MKQYSTLVVNLVALMVAGLPAAWILDTDMPCSIVVAGTGIISFFWLYAISLPDKSATRDKESALRFAIAG